LEKLMSDWSTHLSPGDILKTQAEGSPFTVLEVRPDGVWIEATARKSRPKLLLKAKLLDALWAHRSAIQKTLDENGGRGVLSAVQNAWEAEGEKVDYQNESQYWSVVAFCDPNLSSSDSDRDYTVVEGGRILLSVSGVERDARLRSECIAKYGTSCVGCGMEFAKRYPGLGDGFIHVHHLKPIAARGKDRVC
jgi:hypothetical protein